MYPVLSLLSVAAGFYLLIMAYMFFRQRGLIYRPSRDLGGPACYGFVKAQAVEIETEDGEKIVAWYAPPEGRQETIVYFHGNTGNIGNRAHKLIGFARAGYGVLAVSWRGYGSSSGRPSEKGLIKDARALLNWLQVPYQYVILYGESLGSGIAVQMATEFPVRFAMLEAPYYSMVGMAQEAYPWLPVRWILQDKFDSISHITRMQSPLLIIHGERDEIIPVEHAKMLFEAAPNPKRMVLYPHIHHTDFSMDHILKPLAEMENHIPH